MAVLVANAPVSYGAFELTVGIDDNVPDGGEVLDQVRAAGYAGIDLGPAGYLGTGTALVDGLARRGLCLAGGYLELPFSEPERMEATFHGLDGLLDVFDSARPSPAMFNPRPTLADAGSEARRARPGQAARDRSLGFDADAWKRFADGVEMAAGRCRERGYEPAFHHETGTHIEAVWEIEKVLELTSVGICLDTGHLLFGQGGSGPSDAGLGRPHQPPASKRRAPRGGRADHRRGGPGWGDLATTGVLPPGGWGRRRGWRARRGSRRILRLACRRAGRPA